MDPEILKSEGCNPICLKENTGLKWTVFYLQFYKMLAKLAFVTWVGWGWHTIYFLSPTPKPNPLIFELLRKHSKECAKKSGL